MVRLGEHTINDKNDGSNPKDFKIIGRHIHQEFNKYTAENDIAVLVLEKPVKYTGNNLK